MYVSYSDIVFSGHVLETEGDAYICIIADRDIQAMNDGRTGNTFEELELLTLVERGWGKGTVNRIGKRCVDSPEEVSEVERGGEGRGRRRGRGVEGQRNRGRRGEGRGRERDEGESG